MLTMLEQHSVCNSVAGSYANMTHEINHHTWAIGEVHVHRKQDTGASFHVFSLIKLV